MWGSQDIIYIILVCGNANSNSEFLFMYYFSKSGEKGIPFSPLSNDHVMHQIQQKTNINLVDFAQ